MAALAPSVAEIAAAIIFAVALLHTFSTRYFQHLAHVQPIHAGLWHLLGEVEVVFGFWAMILLLFLVAQTGGTAKPLHYLETRNFTEPAFVFVIMVIAASRPILDLAGAMLHLLSRVLPLERQLAYYVTVLSMGPLLGSFITEPAAMTLSALLLRQRFFSRNAPKGFLYATVGVLFVNVSIGGTLTPYAAPPVLMVADKWGLDIGTMLKSFGWKAAIAVFINASAATFLYRKYLRDQPPLSPALARLDLPAWIVMVHVALLTAIVVFSHHAIVFIALFLLFLGFTEAYKRYQSRLMLREGLMVAFFLGGLVVLGGQQKWWLQPLLSGLSPTGLYYGATLLTAITDNAALTYLGSLVDGVSEAFKYSMVAGAVTGGGLTVIANAPNPAGFAILKDSFEDGTIGALGLALAATPPTLMAVAAFQLLPG
jgi:Putative Na+/H+ antiporter